MSVAPGDAWRFARLNDVIQTASRPDPEPPFHLTQTGRNP